MMRTCPTCPNCAAPIAPDARRCEYCRYYIELESPALTSGRASLTYHGLSRPDEIEFFPAIQLPALPSIPCIIPPLPTISLSWRTSSTGPK